MSYATKETFTAAGSSSTFRSHGQGLSALYGVGYTKIEEAEAVIEQNLSRTFDALLQSLNLLVDKYSNAQFDNLDRLYDENNDTIGNELLKIKNNMGTSIFKSSVRNFMKQTFEGIQQSVIQYSNLINTMEKLDKCQEKSSILDDPEKLKEYLEEKKRSRYLFEIDAFEIVRATLKPEYARYVELYGFPESAIFDTDKLTRIRNELGITT